MTNKKITALNNSFTEFLLYKTPAGKVKVEIFLRDENIWLTQEKIAMLFGVDRSVITKHLKNIFETNELSEYSVCAKFAHTAADEKSYQTKFYNLDAIISVGYRVNSSQATHFRIWANQVLKEYIIKGFCASVQNFLADKIRKSEVVTAKNFLGNYPFQQVKNFRHPRFRGDDTRDDLNLLKGIPLSKSTRAGPAKQNCFDVFGLCRNAG